MRTLPDYPFYYPLKPGIDAPGTEKNRTALENYLNGGGVVEDPFGKKGPIEPTFHVAASDARAEVKTLADYVCDGIDDEVQIIEALVALSALGHNEGVVQLSAGTFSIGATIDPGLPHIAATWLRGQGIGNTIIETGGIAPNINDVMVHIEQRSRISDMSIVSNHADWYRCATVYAGSRNEPSVMENCYLELNNSGIFGMMAIYLENYGQVRNCIIGSNHHGHGINVGGNGVVIDNNAILRSSEEGVGSGRGQGIYCGSSFGADSQVTFNLLDNSGTYGIQWGGDRAMIVGNRSDTGSLGAIYITSGSDGSLYGGNKGTVLDSGTNTVTFDNGVMESVVTLTIPGTLATGLDGFRWYAPFALTVLAVEIAVGTAPTGADVILDVNKATTTLFTTQTNRPTITAAGFVSGDAVPDVTAVANGDYLRLEVDQIGSTIAGADLTCTIRFRRIP